MREGDAGIPLAEMRHLLPPAQMIATEPVCEHEQRPAASNFIIETAAGPIQIAAFHARLSDTEKGNVELLRRLAQVLVQRGERERAALREFEVAGVVDGQIETISELQRGGPRVHECLRIGL